MGTCYLSKSIEVCSMENDFNTDVISLFRPYEKNVQTTIPWYMSDDHDDEEYYLDVLKNNPDLRFVYYETTVGVLRDRLNILGYDLETAKEAFNAWVKKEREHYLSRKRNLEIKSPKENSTLASFYRNKCDILAKLSPDIWIEKIKKINDNFLETVYNEFIADIYEDKILEYMLTNEWYGFPGYDIFVPLRLAMDALDDNDKMIYDLHDTVWSGTFDYDIDFVHYGLEMSTSEYISHAKTVVLTEGKTDAWILSESMKLLYPHLKDYYSFLDFESTGFGGGVGNLANVVKAFAGAGIVNNVIALFDNDTAASSACRIFNDIDLPSNIVVCHLPEIELLKNYPTIGPSGLVNLDVNGIAASIELYLGEDVLRIDGSNLSPVQWTGFDKSTDHYQGEVIDKAQLQKRFRDKFDRALKGEQCNWDDLKQIFDLLFRAFSDQNHGIICSRASAYYYN